jgi:ATP dependent DNA ligase-like protein
VLDGEIICADPDGRPNFSALQDDLKRGRHDRFVYYAFDLLHLDGRDTRPAPLIERKRVLQSVLDDTGTRTPRLLYSEHFEDGAGLYERVSAMALDGHRIQEVGRAIPFGPLRALDQGEVLETEKFFRERASHALLLKIFSYRVHRHGLYRAICSLELRVSRPSQH